MNKAIIVFVALFALAFASEEFLKFVRDNKDNLNKLRAAYRKCKEQCSEKKSLSCYGKCIAAEVSSKSEDFEEIMSEMFAQSDAETAQSINQRGLDLIKDFEGFRSCVYKDAAGLPTIGYGHLIKSGEQFTCITQAQAEALLRKDVGTAESCVTSAVKTSLTSNQFSALVSFTFNVGCGNLKSSTLLRELNAGNKGAVCTQLLRWNKAGGKELPGLTRRRQAECNLFNA